MVLRKNFIYTQALIQTGRFDEVGGRVLLAPDQGPMGKGTLLYRICNTFFLVGEDGLAHDYAQQLKEFAMDHPDLPFYLAWLGQAEMFQGNWKEAVRHFEAFFKINLLDRRRVSPIVGDLVACYAHLGMIDKMELPQIESSPKVQGKMRAYCEARAQTILENYDEALESLSKAIQLGYEFNDWSYQFDYHFRPLFEDPRFQQLVKPKG